MAAAPMTPGEFIRRLNAARLERHLSLRAAGRIAGVAFPTAQGWLSGKHLPTPALRPNFLRLVEHLGLSEEIPDGFWQGSWDAVQPALRTGRPPYLGLRPFGVGDAPNYCGRDAEARRLAFAILELREREGTGLVALVGPSGCGKSSLLAAGLVAHECADGVLAGWSTALLKIEEINAAGELDLAVIDQFEDVLLLDEPTRAAAIEQLEHLSRRMIVVIGLRSDAFTAASQEPALVGALSRPVLLAPLSRAELREVIVAPARLAGVTVDEDLVHVLQSELAPGKDAVAPDVLPLLSNVLLVTWAAGSSVRMTLADYRAVGGVASALESLAEGVFHSLDDLEQQDAKLLFLRMVSLAADSVVRRSAPLTAIDERSRPVMEAFVAARMLTVADGQVRISHDALLVHWSRLGEWIADSRSDLDTLAKLRRAAEVWVDTDRDPAALIPVHRLAAFTSWLDEPGNQELLSGVEREYLAASQEHLVTALDAERRTSARLRDHRRVAVGLAALATASAVVAGVAWVRGGQFEAQAVSARNEAQSRQVATTASSLRAKDPNLVSQMALVAQDLAETRESRSALVGATAIEAPTRWAGLPEAVLAVDRGGRMVVRADSGGQLTIWRDDDLTRSPGVVTRIDPRARALRAVALAERDGRTLLAVAGAGVKGLWDVTGEPRRLADLAVQDAQDDADGVGQAVVFSPDGSLVAFGDDAGEVQLWGLDDPAAPRHVAAVRLDSEGEARPAVAAIAIDGHGVLYVGGATGSLARWRLGVDTRPQRLADLRTVHVAEDGSRTPSRVQAVAASPDGRWLAAGIAGRQVFRWQIDRDRATELDGLRAFTSWVNGVAFSSDSTRLIAASSDQDVTVYDAASGEELRRLTNPSIMTSAGFSGDRPVAVGTDGTVRVWSAESPLWRMGGSVMYNLSSDGLDWLAGGTPEDGIVLWRLGDPVRRMPTPEVSLPAGVAQDGAVAVAPNGRFLVGATAQGDVLSWPLGPDGAGSAALTDTDIGYISWVTVSPDSSLVAAIEYLGTRTVLLRADAAGRLRKLATIDTPDPQVAMFSGDGSLLAVALADRRVALWSVADPERPVLAGVVDGFETLPMTLALGSSSPLLAVGEESGGISLWNIADPAGPVRTRLLDDPSSGMYSLAFSPDERLLIGTSGDDRIWGWDLASDQSGSLFALDSDLGRPWDARFIDDGHFAVSGSTGRVRVWSSDLARAREQLCAGRGEPLTSDEWRRYLPGVEFRDPCRARR